MDPETKAIKDRLGEFYTSDEIEVWLYAPNELLGGARAVDLLRDGKGDEVSAAIDRLAALSTC